MKYKQLILIFTATLCVLFAGNALAQTNININNTNLIRFGGSVIVLENQAVENAISFGGSVTVSPNAKVMDTAIAFGGDILLQKGARVEGDVYSFGGKIVQEPGAIVGGTSETFNNEQTIEANQLQAYRDPAQRELADWIRLSSQDADAHRDGLTTAGMEIEGFSGWVVRNFYGKENVMKPDFRERGIDQIRQEVSESAGWILITSKDNSVETLLETGKRMQRLFLKVRERSIAIHPMTQILEEASTRERLNQSIGINNPIQFILRTGYVNDYPPPVSLRRPVDRFLRT